MCKSFLMAMVSVAFSGYINMMVFAGAEMGVLRIQTSGDICVGRFTSKVFLICNTHWAVISARCIEYRAETHEGGFAKGWKGVVKLQNWAFASWQTQNWLVESSTAMVASIVMPRYLVLMSRKLNSFHVGCLGWGLCGWWFVGTYVGWVHQSAVKIVCFQSGHDYVSICKKVWYHLGETGRCSIGGKLSDICNNIFCRSMTGRMCGERVPDVAALI